MTNAENGGIIRKASIRPSDGKTKHYAHKIGNIDVSDQDAVDRLVARFEEHYVDSKLEHCLIIRPNGEVYVARGDERSVETGLLLGDKMKGSFTVHNHPKDETKFSFSFDDFSATLLDSGKRMMAFDFKYEYEAVFPDRAISLNELNEVYEAVKDIKYDLFDQTELDPENDYEENIQHIIITEMCKRLGITYTRRDR